MKKQITLALTCGFLLLCAAAWGSQNPLSVPTSGTLSGLSLVQDINNANDALATCNSGGSAPSTQFLSGSPSNSDCWDDTSTSGWIKHKIWMNGSFVVAAFYDLANSLYTGIVGGGAINNVASAATTDLCSVNPAYLNITGSTTITSFGSTCQVGVWKRIQFSGALTLTYNATSLIIQTGANITTAAGDTADVVALGSGNWIVTAYHRATGAALSTAGLNVGANALGNSALTFTVPVNLGLTASVPSNQLQVNFTGANGSAPSSSNPVLIPFRSSTLGTGTPTVDSLQSSINMTVASNLSMGCTTAVTCRVWIYAIDNAGTVLVGLQTCSNATQIFACNDDLLYATNGNTTGSNFNGVLASTVANLSGKAVRIVGYLEAIWTSGTGWAAPSKLELFGPGMKKPGDVVQEAYSSAGSQAITPSSAINLVRLNSSINCAASQSASASTVAYKRGSTTLVTHNLGGSGSTGMSLTDSVMLLDNPVTASSVTYSIVQGGTSCGVQVEALDVQEIMSALEPARGDDAPLALVG